MMTITLADQRKKILKQLAALALFSNTATVRKLRRELRAKLESVQTKILHQRRTKKARQVTPSKRKTPKPVRKAKMKKIDNYVLQIRHNYPELNLSKTAIKQQLRERKQGKHTKIPDVIWRNPSP